MLREEGRKGTKGKTEVFIYTILLSQPRLTTPIRIYQYHDYQSLKSPIEVSSTIQISFPGSGGLGVC